MTSGPPLQLPPTSVGTLSYAYTSHISDCARTSVYYLYSSSFSATTLASLCDSLTTSYVRDVLGDESVEDYHRFLTPICTPFARVQDCIKRHFETLDKWILEHQVPNEDTGIYPFSIVVFEENEKEALLVHLDYISKRWHIGSIRLPATDLALDLSSLMMGDEWFGDLCYKYGVSVPQNDPAIDENWKDHEKDETGAWKNNAPRFAVFLTGMSHALPVKSMLDDAHDNAPFGHQDVELFGLTGGRYLGDKDQLRAQFLVYVAADQRGEKRHEGKGPCLSCKPLHKSIFIEVDDPDPRTNGVLVSRMKWSQDTEGKTDDQLTEIGKKAEITTNRVGVAFAVAAAKAMAMDDLTLQPEIWKKTI